MKIYEDDNIPPGTGTIFLLPHKMIEDHPDAYMPMVYAARSYYRWYRRLWRRVKGWLK